MYDKDKYRNYSNHISSWKQKKNIIYFRWKTEPQRGVLKKTVFKYLKIYKSLVLKNALNLQNVERITSKKLATFFLLFFMKKVVLLHDSSSAGGSTIF